LYCGRSDRAWEGSCRTTGRAIGSTEDVVEGLGCEGATAGLWGLVGGAVIVVGRHDEMWFRLKAGRDGLMSDLRSRVVVEERFFQWPLLLSSASGFMADVAFSGSFFVVWGIASADSSL
jgi:hypothetical protein